MRNPILLVDRHRDMGIIAPFARSIDPPRNGPGAIVWQGDDNVEPVETVTVDKSTVACDGDGGATGHPRVFLNMGAKGEIDCPYCGRRYVLKDGAEAGGGH